MADAGKSVEAPHERASDTLEIGTCVRRRRRDLGLRQAELADLAGVSERFVHSIENGKRTLQLDKLITVLDAVGLQLQIHRGGAVTPVPRPTPGPDNPT